MKYSKEIKKAVEKIKYQDKNKGMYYIGFYALYLKSKNKMVIFNHKISEETEYEPKFLWEFDVEDSTKNNLEDILMDILTKEGIKQNHIYEGNKYDYSRIEFIDHKRDVETEYLTDDVYFVNVVENKIEDTRIEQFIEG